MKAIIHAKYDLAELPVSSLSPVLVLTSLQAGRFTVPEGHTLDIVTRVFDVSQWWKRGLAWDGVQLEPVTHTDASPHAVLNQLEPNPGDVVQLRSMTTGTDAHEHGARAVPKAGREACRPAGLVAVDRPSIQAADVQASEPARKLRGAGPLECVQVRRAYKHSAHMTYHPVLGLQTPCMQQLYHVKHE